MSKMWKVCLESFWQSDVKLETAKVFQFNLKGFRNRQVERPTSSTIATGFLLLSYLDFIRHRMDN